MSPLLRCTYRNMMKYVVSRFRFERFVISLWTLFETQVRNGIEVMLFNVYSEFCYCLWRYQTCLYSQSIVDMSLPTWFRMRNQRYTLGCVRSEYHTLASATGWETSPCIQIETLRASGMAIVRIWRVYSTTCMFALQCVVTGRHVIPCIPWF